MRPLAIIGPTGTGKSALALDVAERLGSAEIVNADAMQLYRGMDVGTAKLRPHEREGVAHHVLDVWDVTEPASVAVYQRIARAAVDDVRSRGRTPLLVGGSGLYVRAVLERFEFPGTDPELRARLEAELAALGPAPLHARLAERDPVAAGRILPGDGRRIVRALEVLELTGAPFTAELPQARPHYRGVSIGVDLDPAALDERIAARVERMWADGLVNEVRALERRGLRTGRTASRALGYQQVLAFLGTQSPGDGEGTHSGAGAEGTRAAAGAEGTRTAEGAEGGEEGAKLATIQATRRFVRRQRSWFRRDGRIVWLDGASSDLVPAALALATGARAGRG